MSKSVPNFVTVDMRELKVALEAQARTEQVSVSDLVRQAVAAFLGVREFAQSASDLPTEATGGRAGRVKLSIRMTEAEAYHLALGARSAGLSRGAYLSGLIANVPALTLGASRPEYLSALVASSSELAGLSRNIHQLTALLRQGDVRQAQAYRAVLDEVDGEVRSHLKLAAAVLSALQPRPSRSA